MRLESYCDALDFAMILIERTFLAGDDFRRSTLGSGNFNAGGNYTNFGNAVISLGGPIQISIGGQVNQDGDLRRPQAQEQRQRQGTCCLFLVIFI